MKKIIDLFSRLFKGKEYPLITKVTPKLQQAVDLAFQQQVVEQNYINILKREKFGDFSFSDFSEEVFQW